MSRRDLLLEMYRAMLEELGPSNWWPGDTAFEVAVGAILTQNTNWQNVEKAIANMKSARVLDFESLSGIENTRLEELIRPAGYYRIKAARLLNFLDFLGREAEGSMTRLAGLGLERVRPKLLAVKGVGPETADSILLYALGLPTFVVDAYTARMMSRHGLAPEDAAYDELRDLFMDALPGDVDLYNEYHALIVRLGKRWCAKRQGLCATCPLGRFLGIAP